MEMLEKVELVREKTGVSYQDAKEALEACEYDVLDAIIWLEKEGKADVKTASFKTSANSATKTTSIEMQEAQEEYQRSTGKKGKVKEVWRNFIEEVKRILQAGMDMSFVAERDGNQVVSLPLLLIILGIFVWGATIWLLILGLFFGFRYHIEGASPVTIDVNDAMNKAAQTAEDIKSDFATKKAEHSTVASEPEKPKTPQAPDMTEIDQVDE